MHHLAFPIENIIFRFIGKHPILKLGGTGGKTVLRTYVVSLQAQVVHKPFRVPLKLNFENTSFEQNELM